MDQFDYLSVVTEYARQKNIQHIDINGFADLISWLETEKGIFNIEAKKLVLAVEKTNTSQNKGG